MAKTAGHPAPTRQGRILLGCGWLVRSRSCRAQVQPRGVPLATAAADLAALGMTDRSRSPARSRNATASSASTAVARPGGKPGTEIAEAARPALVGYAALRPVPESFKADGADRVMMLVRVSGTRPDGRSFDNPQVLLFTLDDDCVRSVDQFVGDPGAVAAFWE